MSAKAASVGLDSRKKWTPDRLLWTRFAACVGRSALFFGELDETDRQRMHRETLASQVCADCPARLACRDHARRHRELGVWGGENDAQRRRARRERRAPESRVAVRS